MAKLHELIGQLPVKQTIYKSFLAGISWSVGATFGFAVFLAITAWILKMLGGIPIIGALVAKIVVSTQHYLAIYPNPLNTGGSL